jgi:phospholipase/carboxylesterase
LEIDLPPLEVETATNPEYSVIWLHGLGADGSDFVPVVPELGLAESPAVRFIFPHAPYMPVTCNGGYVMRTWYDIISLDSNSRRIDEAGIIASRETIRRLIERENGRGIPVDRIFLAGFSQGGALAYTTALPYRTSSYLVTSLHIPTNTWITR